MWSSSNNDIFQTKPAAIMRSRAFSRFLRPPFFLWLLPVLLVGCEITDSEQSPQATFVLEGRLFESSTGQMIDDGVVVISGDTVACSGARQECEWPDETPVRRYDNATMLPGLIDLHVHARPQFVGAFLPSGVTTIRDANNTIAVVERLRASEHSPRVFTSGPLLDGPGSVISQMSTTAGSLGEYPLKEIMPIHVEDAEDASQAVEMLADAGVDLIKLYALLDQETFEAAVATAQDHGLPTAADLGMLFTQGLAGANVDIVQAAEAGVTTIEHMSGLTLAYQRRGGDPLDDELKEAILDEIAEELASTDVAMVPTLANLVQFSNPGSLTDAARRLCRYTTVFPDPVPLITGRWQRVQKTGGTFLFIEALEEEYVTRGSVLIPRQDWKQPVHFPVYPDPGVCVTTDRASRSCGPCLFPSSRIHAT